MALTKKQRDALPDDDFAMPGKRELPIHDEVHVREAWDMVDRTEGLSEGEKAEARRRILERARRFGIDTSEWKEHPHFEWRWDKPLHHVRLSGFAALGAMSLQLPEVPDHPNRMPFSGVLTYVDMPSDMAVGGSGGKKTYLPRAVAEAALPSLLGMAIDFTPNFDGHDPTRKIGLISDATIIGKAVQIQGFFYAEDFPQECARIRAEKNELGFSYEFKAQTQPMTADVTQIVSGSFTGAAVLYKDKAAYQSTSLAAKAEELTMTEDELKALLAEAIAPIAATLTSVTADIAALKAKGSGDPLQANKDMIEKIKPHATALRNCAAAMEAAGIGLHSTSGHVTVLHHMAAHMEAAAARGETPYIYRDHDWTFRGSVDPHARPNGTLAEDPALKALDDKVSAATTALEALATKITDLQAASFRAATPPDRKTLPAEITSLLAKGHLTEDQTKSGLTEVELSQVLDKAGITNRQDRIATKLAVTQSGLLKAA